MKIILTGSIAIDRIMSFDGAFADLIQPDKLHVLSISTIVDRFRETRGGTAANIAYSLVLLGEKPVLLASVGRDARTYMNSLKRKGVDTSLLHFSRQATACFQVLTDKNDCQVGGFYPGAVSDAEQLTIKRALEELGKKNGDADKNGDGIFVVVSAHDPKTMVTQIKECQQLQQRLFFDIGQQILVLSGEDLRLGVDVAELLIVNDYEMGLLQQKTGWSLEQIVQRLRVCVVTLGGKGCEFYEGGAGKRVESGPATWRFKKQLVPAVKLKKIVDPTGAGDAFRAGFLYGYVRGWPSKKAAQLGSVVASFVVEQHGTQEHQLTRTRVARRYQQTYDKKLEW